VRSRRINTRIHLAGCENYDFVIYSPAEGCWINETINDYLDVNNGRSNRFVVLLRAAFVHTFFPSFGNSRALILDDLFYQR